jgi:hypothetical protein
MVKLDKNIKDHKKPPPAKVNPFTSATQRMGKGGKGKTYSTGFGKGGKHAMRKRKLEEEMDKEAAALQEKQKAEMISE